jgi:hypothetical protein
MIQEDRTAIASYSTAIVWQTATAADVFGSVAVAAAQM